MNVERVPTVEELFRIAPGDEYLSQDVLHFKPVTSRLFTATNILGLSLERALPRDFKILALVFEKSAYICNTVVATAEIITTFTCFLLLYMVDEVTSKQYQPLSKIKMKMAAQGINSLLIALAQGYLLFKFHALIKRTDTAVLEQGCFFLSASHATQRPAMVFKEYILEAERGLTHAVNRDVQLLSGMEHILLRRNTTWEDVTDYLGHHRSFRRLLAPDSASNLSDLFKLQDKILKFILRDEVSQVITTSHVSEQEHDYQVFLKQHVKAAFVQIYLDEALACLLSNKNVAQEGREALESYDADIYTPLAHFAELCELESKDIECPATFTTEELLQYNNRRQRIAAAREKLAVLEVGERDLLVKRLFKGDAFVYPEGTSDEAQERIRVLYVKIGELGGQLHQGNLMSQKTLDAETGMPSSKNLFQSACQQATATLGLT